MAYLLGYDLGSSSIKASLLAADGRLVASAVSPQTELAIDAPRPGWAEQHPETWWQHVQAATAMLLAKAEVKPEAIKAIGISYQMHGLVLVDKAGQVLRPAIIWCDSRAAEIGDRAFHALGPDLCLSRLLNSPGNFTASKLKWVQENEPAIYQKIYKAMLPGDYLAMKLTGNIQTTPSGLSEGILWDYQEQKLADLLLDHYGIDRDLIPEVVPTFAPQGELTKSAADALGLKPGTLVAYRAGDQPNNAFSLNVMNPGEVAATAGTSGVVYGVGAQPEYDRKSRVNTFLHVNHRPEDPRLGILLCLNGTGILNRWLKKNLMQDQISYEEMNHLAAQVPAGAEGLMIFPYGNGAERTLENKTINASIRGLNFNLHHRGHLLRAAQEGIVFALNYGLNIMKNMGVQTNLVRAGQANMFLSPLFCEVFATVTGARVELYNTDGAQGAARGAGLGAGIYPDPSAAFTGLQSQKITEPNPKLAPLYQELYAQWERVLTAELGQ
ncbi:xylulokinase [Capillibacterium thermochitinicola]|uniref:Carbohydrate kinase n=1 Tax=Capillibacterium thermochitinicola TaxID=2699427 RepID=A0A8J6LIU4_9FIRM|nr:FGGY family carbohydrate kinase [Capillibacterium thermochitinicola]MBA2133036.1 carbohydrate kinase [Capillibacterium thermochitinicola]